MVAKLLLLDKAGRRPHTAAMPADLPILKLAASADPYAAYARLRERGPVVFDAEAGLWLASTAEAVDAALRHPALRVRPPAEPVPRALQGTAAGEVFAQLVRMNDGAFHAEHRPPVDQAIRALAPDAVAGASRRAAEALWDRGDLDGWLHGVPVRAMAQVLGVAEADLDMVTAEVLAFTQGIAPQASPEQVADAARAAAAWMARCGAQDITGPRAANRLALMQQSVDATAGLIGNALLRLQRAPQAPDAAFIAEVARWDPPIHHTRRFAAEDVRLMGQDLRAGDGILVLLASANRDPAAQPHAHAFDPLRQSPQDFGFGAGPHACPGRRIALALAHAAVRYVADQPQRLAALRFAGEYRPLANARIPLLH